MLNHCEIKDKNWVLYPRFQPKEQNLQPWAISQWLWWTFSLKKGRFYQCHPPSQPDSNQQPTSDLYFISTSSLFRFQRSPLSYFSSYLLSSYFKFTIFSFPSLSPSLTPTQTPGSCQLPPFLLDQHCSWCFCCCSCFSLIKLQRKRSSGYQNKTQ